MKIYEIFNYRSRKLTWRKLLNVYRQNQFCRPVCLTTLTRQNNSETSAYSRQRNIDISFKLGQNCKNHYQKLKTKTEYQPKRRKHFPLKLKKQLLKQWICCVLLAHNLFLTVAEKSMRGSGRQFLKCIILEAFAQPNNIISISLLTENNHHLSKARLAHFCTVHQFNTKLPKFQSRFLNFRYAF